MKVKLTILVDCSMNKNATGSPNVFLVYGDAIGQGLSQPHCSAAARITPAGFAGCVNCVCYVLSFLRCVRCVRCVGWKPLYRVGVTLRQIPLLCTHACPVCSTAHIHLEKYCVSPSNYIVPALKCNDTEVNITKQM